MNKTLKHPNIYDGIWREIRNRPEGLKLKNRGLFLDRDGTIIQLISYLDDPSKVKIINGIIELIYKANNNGIKVIMITNQSGISRGYFDWNAFSKVNDKIMLECESLGAHFDAIYACPDHPNEPTNYRKPNPGMLLTAAKDLKLDLTQSIIVGDSIVDLQAGKRAGLNQGWLVSSGNGKKHLKAALSIADSNFSVHVKVAPHDVESALT
tara:strand:+ start:45419 stop:46045 length:627 start_codon:yes stop_codon:yes gene_type:complete